MEDESTALFLIKVTNDGNKPLKSLNITDHLPEGLIFLNSSMRAEANGPMINWTIPSLDIGRTLTIKMRAKIGDASKCYTNTVRVSAAWEDGIIEARNSTTFEPYYQPLPCCPGAAVAKDSKINATRIFNVIALDRNWGEWKPSPCLNISSNVTECSALMDAYYNELEKSAAVSCCASNYEVP